MNGRFTEDQKNAYDAFCSGKNILLTGSAGTGKSYLVRQMIEKARSDGRTVAVTASTGIAASLLPGGRTIHSLLHAYPNMSYYNIDYQKKISNLENVDVLIIDEISMVGRSFIPYLFHCLLAAGNRIQLIVVGDFFQLPPVRDEYAFKSPFWDALKLTPCVLHQVVRQCDEEMIWNINRLKYGDVGCLPYFISHSSRERFEKQITICAKKEDAVRINQLKTEGTEGRSHTYRALIDGHYSGGDLPAEKTLILKVGSRVMATVNSDEYVNGSLGTVINLEEDAIDVLLDNGTETRFIRRIFDIDNFDDSRERAAIHQFPLRLAHAITIHKSQGQTFDCVNIDGSACWAPGQLYVAISRAKSIEKLHFSTPISRNNIKTDYSVVQYYRKIDRDPDDTHRKSA